MTPLSFKYVAHTSMFWGPKNFFNRNIGMQRYCRFRCDPWEHGPFDRSVVERIAIMRTVLNCRQGERILGEYGCLSARQTFLSSDRQRLLEDPHLTSVTLMAGRVVESKFWGSKDVLYPCLLR